MKIFKIITLATSIVVGIIAIIYGVRLQDIFEIIANGSILCLSCVGIG